MYSIFSGKKKESLMHQSIQGKAKDVVNGEKF